MCDEEDKTAPDGPVQQNSYSLSLLQKTIYTRRNIKSIYRLKMNPETRRLIKVMPEDAERTAHYFDVLLGDALNDRKNFISENGAKYLDLADIS